MRSELPAASMVLAVCAHPDDESFGLGGVLGAYTDAGARAAVLCFTAGEASTLGGAAEDLAAVRGRELAAAGEALGLVRVELLAYPDGALATIPEAELAAHVHRLATRLGSDLLLVFDEGGISGHPDHCRATEAALAAAQDGAYRVLAWAIPKKTADALNREFGAQFVGREEAEIDAVIPVDRARQGQAIACHRSQATQNPVLWRRLELLGPQEWLRILPASRQEVASGRCLSGATGRADESVKEE